MESVFGEKKFRGGERKADNKLRPYCMRRYRILERSFFIKNQELVIMNKFDNLIKKHEFNSFINY